MLEDLVFVRCLLFLLVGNMMYSQVECMDHSHHHHAVEGPVQGCDTGKWRLEVDWIPQEDKFLFQCQAASKSLPEVQATNQLETNLPDKHLVHKCMNKKLDYQALYNTDLPTSGAHRLVWPEYGEYRYLPPQRWLHGIAHGAIAALYHPCARKDLVAKFKRLVTGCLRKHMISPYGKLPKDRPFALVAWNNRLQLNTPNEAAIVSFIKNHALRGPKDIPEDGAYNFALLKPAATVSDFKDSELCPETA